MKSNNSFQLFVKIRCARWTIMSRQYETRTFLK